MATVDVARDRGLQDYRKKLLEHKEVESRLKESKFSFDWWLDGNASRLCLQKCQVILMHLNTEKNIFCHFSARAIERINQTIR